MGVIGKKNSVGMFEIFSYTFFHNLALGVLVRDLIHAILKYWIIIITNGKMISLC